MRKERLLHAKDNLKMTCLDGCFQEQRAIVLCLHGLAGDKNSSVICRLSQVMREENIGTFTFDWPAHGNSPESERYFTTAYCQEYIRAAVSFLKDKYGSLPLYCFATSFGGYMAMLYHLNHPDTFDKIFLRSPALNIADTLTGFMNENQMTDVMNGKELDFGFDRPLLLTKAHYDDIKAHDIYSSAPLYPEKIFIIHGELDDVVPVRDSQLYAEKNGIKLYVLAGADHRYKNPGDVEAVMKKAKRWFL